MDPGTFKVIGRDSIRREAKIPPGRFELAVKTPDTGKARCKARYVVGDHRDGDEHTMMHSASTLQPKSARLLLSFAALHGFGVCTSDEKQA